MWPYEVCDGKLQAKVKELSLLGQRSSVHIRNVRQHGNQRGRSLVDSQTSLLGSWQLTVTSRTVK